MSEINNSDESKHVVYHFDPTEVSAILRAAKRPSIRSMIAKVLMIVVPMVVLIAIYVFVIIIASDPKPISEDYVVMSKSASKDKVVLISISGSIGGSGSHLTGKKMLHQVAFQMRFAAADDNVKAVILQIDSPGGGLTASDVLNNEVKLLKASGKEVIVLVGNLAASGGYYIAAPADYIIASPTSLIGSFGVIMPHMQVEELLEKIGVKMTPIKSAAMKDIGSPFRDMTEDEKAYFQKIISHYHNRFVDVIVDGRKATKITRAEVEALANGKIYTAQESLGFKLIDEIGYMDDALAKAKELAKLDDPNVVAYHAKLSIADLLQAKFDMTLTRYLGSANSEQGVSAKWDGGK